MLNCGRVRLWPDVHYHNMAWSLVVELPCAQWRHQTHTSRDRLFRRFRHRVQCRWGELCSAHLLTKVHFEQLWQKKSLLNLPLSYFCNCSKGPRLCLFIGRAIGGGSSFLRPSNTPQFSTDTVGVGRSLVTVPGVERSRFLSVKENIWHFFESVSSATHAQCGIIVSWWFYSGCSWVAKRVRPPTLSVPQP